MPNETSASIAKRQPIDENLIYRVKDVGDALGSTQRLDQRRHDAVIDRLIAAADHLGAASVGSTLAGYLTDSKMLRSLAHLFGRRERVLDTAALTLAAVSTHSALDLCASAALAAVDGYVAIPGRREPGLPALQRRATKDPLPGLFAQWLTNTLGPRYDELELWRDPQTHRPVPKAVFGDSSDGEVRRLSVRIYRPTQSGGKLIEEFLGTAAEKLPGFVAFGEERFLALCYVLRETYAPNWKR